MVFTLATALLLLQIARCTSFLPIRTVPRSSDQWLPPLLHSTAPKDAAETDPAVYFLEEGISGGERLLVHWRGENTEGYSMQFRHTEFRGALAAVCNRPIGDLTFSNALAYDGTIALPEPKLARFNQAMQYLTSDNPSITIRECARAAERCALIHAVYAVVARGPTFSALADRALADGGFVDMEPGQRNQDATWCVRVRHYGEASGAKKQRRHGERTRSLSLERVALQALKPLLLTFGGGVNLQYPDCKIYIFDGLADSETKLLTRRVAVGGRGAYTIAPNTRICITNTPLDSISSFLLCNAGEIRQHHRILDPYAGSCSILLAAALIEPTVHSVGIEIAHDGLVNRDDIRRDFSSRNLTQPHALLRGDCTDQDVRKKARFVLPQDGPFDCILTDPPYGIRESVNYNTQTPIQELFEAIHMDRCAGTPLLKLGGKLVCFIPVTENETIAEALPTKEQQEEVGLILRDCREQPLNDKLSRWLAVFDYVA